eukprot:631416-Pelagomonas_calceolata.AAC.2
MTFWERANTNSGSFEADCIFLIVEGACAVLKGNVDPEGIANLQPATTPIAARTDIECACCKICNYPGVYEPINSESPYLDTGMYTCDVCQ